MLLGHQLWTWGSGMLVLFFAGIFIYTGGAALKLMKHQFIELKAGPIAHLTLNFSDPGIDMKSGLLDQLKSIPGVEKLRSAIIIEDKMKVWLEGDEQRQKKEIKIIAVDLSYPPIPVKLEYKDKLIGAYCEIFDSRNCRICCDEKLEDYCLKFRQIGEGKDRLEIDWEFIIRESLGNDLYLLSIGDPDIDDAVYAYRQAHSLEQFVPDFSTCINEFDKGFLYQVVNFHRIKEYSKNIFSSVLLSRPLLQDLDPMAYDNDTKFFVELPSGRQMALTSSITFNTKLARQEKDRKRENDRIIIMALDRFRELAGTKGNNFNAIEMRLSDPDKAEQTAKEVCQILASMNQKYKDIRTWEDKIFDGSFKLILFFDSFKIGFLSATGLTCVLAILSIFYILYDNTMHHQMLLRLVGLENLTLHYAAIGLFTALLPGLLLTGYFYAIYAYYGISDYKTFAIALSLQFFSPILASCILGGYYKSTALNNFLEG